MEQNRELSELRKLIQSHLEIFGLFSKKAAWEVRESPFGGFGTFATRDIQPGEIIYVDNPLAIGPRVAKNCGIFCVNCLKTPEESTLRACSEGCGLPVCGEVCQESTLHRKECELIKSWINPKGFKEIQKIVFKALAPVRCLFLSKAQKELIQNLHYFEDKIHGFEIRNLIEKLEFTIQEEDLNFLIRVCSVLDANAFEVTDKSVSLRGLYPLSALANHSCIPNAFHVFHSTHRMISPDTVLIPKGAEIFHSYTSIRWSTTFRRFHLMRTKRFMCTCSRCLDPTEFGTNLGALLCRQGCGGFLLPEGEREEWVCRGCGAKVGESYVGMVISVLGAALGGFRSEEVEEIRRFLKERLLKIVPECNSTVVEVKWKLVWILGYRDGYLLEERDASMKHRDAADVSDLLVAYLRSRRLLRETDKLFLEIKKSHLGGLGTFATKDIRKGEIIYVDAPIVIGPKAVLRGEVFCVSCYKSCLDESVCGNGCGLPVCCESCQNSSQHQMECKKIIEWNNGKVFKRLEKKLFECLTPVRALFLDNFLLKLLCNLYRNKSSKHGFEVDYLKNNLQLNLTETEEQFLKQVCCVLDSNTFDVIIDNMRDTKKSLRGLYPLASLTNHSCIPNVLHVFDENHNMVVRAAVDIKKSSEIFHSYTSLFWNTHSRRFDLLHKKSFVCDCCRCLDRTEFGTNMNAILCPFCRDGYLLPKELKSLKSDWVCGSCSEEIPLGKIGMMLSVLGASVANCQEKSVEDLMNLLKSSILKVVPECNSIALELKYKLILSIGYGGYSWRELSVDLLELKMKYCEELLNLLEKLGAGMCKLRGLLLYELFCSKREHNRRAESIKDSSEDSSERVDPLLEEAAEILMYDVGAPDEVKELNKSKQSMRILKSA